MSLHRLTIITISSFIAAGWAAASSTTTTSQQPQVPWANQGHGIQECLPGARASYPTFQDRALTRLIRAVSAAPTAPERADLLAEFQRAAVATPLATDRFAALELCGHEAYRAGAFDLSENTFRMLAADVQAPQAVRSDSLRMVGQILLYVRGDAAAALDRYQAMLAIITASNAPAELTAGPFAEAYEKSGVALSFLGRYREAAAARAQVYENFASQRTSSEIAGLLVASAADLERAGDARHAALLYQRVLDVFPDYGLIDGQSVAIRFAMVRAAAPIAGPARTLNELASIWNDPAAAGFDQTITVGLALAKMQDSLGLPDQAEQTLTDVLIRITDMLPSEPGEAVSESLVAMHKTCLLNLATDADRRGDAERARSYYSLFINYYPTDRNAQVYWELSLPKTSTR